MAEYTVAIFGESYTLRSDESSERLLDAVSLVDETMKEVARSSTRDVKSIAVLAALRIACQANESRVHVESCRELAVFIDDELTRLGMAPFEL